MIFIKISIAVFITAYVFIQPSDQANTLKKCFAPVLSEECETRVEAMPGDKVIGWYWNRNMQICKPLFASESGITLCFTEVWAYRHIESYDPMTKLECEITCGQSCMIHYNNESIKGVCMEYRSCQSHHERDHMYIENNQGSCPRSDMRCCPIGSSMVSPNSQRNKL